MQLSSSGGKHIGKLPDGVQRIPIYLVLESVRIHFLPILEEIGKGQNRKVSELESVRIGKCQNRKVS